MSNPNHDDKGLFSSGPGAGEGPNRQTMTQAHTFRTRGNIRVKPSVHAGLSGRGGGGGGGGSGGRMGHKLRKAAKEIAQLHQDLDRSGRSGGGGQAMGEAGSDFQARAKQGRARRWQ